MTDIMFMMAGYGGGYIGKERVHWTAHCYKSKYESASQRQFQILVFNHPFYLEVLEY